MEKDMKRYGYVDILRIISAFAVCTIHVLSIIAQDTIVLAKPGVALTMDIVHRWCNWSVPVFYMITGIVWLGSDRECTYKEVGRHIWKFALVLVTIGLLYPTIGYLDSGIKMSKVFLAAFKDWFSGDAWYHLWYVYDVIGAYLFLPIAKAVFDKGGKTLKTATIVTFVMMVFRKLPFTVAIDYPVMGYAFYLFMGGIFARCEITKKKFIASIIGFFVSSAIVIYAAMKWGVQFNSFVFYGYRTIPAFVLALSIMTIVRYVAKNYQPGKFILALSGATWGIYLIHPLFLHYMTKLGIYPLKYNAHLSVPLACVIVFALSFAVVWVLRLIKPIRKYYL